MIGSARGTAGAPRLHQLHQGLQAVQRSWGRIRSDTNFRGVRFKPVSLLRQRRLVAGPLRRPGSGGLRYQFLRRSLFRKHPVERKCGNSHQRRFPAE
jgi:hypothetical protein